MIRIQCPYCGERDHSEFTYGEDASRQVPTMDADLAQWNEYVYIRQNVRGEHLEYWHHSLGCRAWLKVQRNTVTHAISWVGLANELPPKEVTS